jgi:hypothetical protein
MAVVWQPQVGMAQHASGMRDLVEQSLRAQGTKPWCIQRFSHPTVDIS